MRSIISREVISYLAMNGSFSARCLFITAGYTTNPENTYREISYHSGQIEGSPTLSNIRITASARRKASGMEIRRIAESSSDRSSHCPAYVANASKGRFISFLPKDPALFTLKSALIFTNMMIAVLCLGVC